MRLLKPVSKNKDIARREFILNVLLLASIVLSSIAFSMGLIWDVFVQLPRNGNSTIQILAVIIVFAIGLYFSKKGRSRFVAFLLLGFYYLLVTSAVFVWGPDMPVALLMFALLIVMSGILINSAFSVCMTAVVTATLFLLVQMALSQRVVFQQSWKADPFSFVDTIIFCTIFALITTVSWLFNREGERALRRARVSEAALKKERDQLAVAVEERTRQLRQEQVEKITQLYRFAEFGRLTSGFVHDLSNSVHLISINLAQIEKGESVDSVHKMILRANVGIRRLESFIEASRKQVNNQDYIQVFSLKAEIRQVIEILSYRAKKAHVTVSFAQVPAIRMRGNPIKFHQLVSNLLSNAIDAYDGVRRHKKVVTISLQKTDDHIYLTVSDQGQGIALKNIEQIFEPFFTTKSFKKGTGIGLSITKDIVEKHFRGTISVRSEVKRGTIFTVAIPHQS